MKVDLVITGGTLATAGGQTRAGLAILGGRIVAIAADEALPEAEERLDATGLYVLPGLIDSHVHVREPGRTDREDFQTATAACAAGGITTLLEMPIASPPVNSAASLQSRVEIVQPKAHVDFALYGGAAGDNLDAIAGMAEAGAVAYKTFRTAAPKGRESEFAGLACVDPGDYLRALERVAETGLPAAVHAEDEWIAQRITRDVTAGGDKSGLSHARSRPPVVEEASVAQGLALARAAGAHLHFVHCSSPHSVDLIQQARKNGVRATAETCPHYLFLTEEALETHGPFAKCNPPLRPAALVDQMWERVVRGDVDIIGTDHSPFLVSEKEAHEDDIGLAPPGFPGLEAFLPLMLTAVNDGRLSLEQMIALTSTNAAKLFGLYPRKGGIHLGADADLALVDLGRAGVIDTRTWHSKARGIARVWHGMPVLGAAVMTLVRGRVVARDNEVVGETGWGQFVKPA